MTSNRIFADTFYWIAVLNPKDESHHKSLGILDLLGDITIVTTETVLIEFLNYFSEYNSFTRKLAANAVKTIMSDESVEYLPHSTHTFLEALDLYENRLDKGYSLTDCVSMLTMRSLGIEKVLTHDYHFEQEGFSILI